MCFLVQVCFGILAFATTLNAVKSEVETADGVQRWAQVLVSLALWMEGCAVTRDKQRRIVRIVLKVSHCKNMFFALST